MAHLPIPHLLLGDLNSSSKLFSDNQLEESDKYLYLQYCNQVLSSIVQQQQQQCLIGRAQAVNCVNGQQPEAEQIENANEMTSKVAAGQVNGQVNAASVTISNQHLASNVSSSYSTDLMASSMSTLLARMTSAPLTNAPLIDPASSNPMANRRLIATNKLDDNGSQSRLFKLSEIAATAVQTKNSSPSECLSSSALNCNQLGNERAIGEQSATESELEVGHPERRRAASVGRALGRGQPRERSPSEYTSEHTSEHSEPTQERCEEAEEASREKCVEASSRSAEEGNKSQDLKDCLMDGEQEQKQSNERLDPWNELANAAPDDNRPVASSVATRKELLPSSVALGDRRSSDPKTGTDSAIGQVNGQANGQVKKSSLTTGQASIGESELAEGELVKEKLNGSGEELASGSLLNGELIRAAKKRKINHSTYGKAGEEEPANSTHSNESKMRPHPAMSRALRQSPTVQQRLDQVEYNLLTNNDLLNAARNIGNLGDLSALASMGHLAGINGALGELASGHSSSSGLKLGRASATSCSPTLASNQTAKQPLDARNGRHANACNDRPARDRAASCNNANDAAQQESTPASGQNLGTYEHPVAMKKPNSFKRSRLSHSPSPSSGCTRDQLNSEINCRLNSSFNSKPGRNDNLVPGLAHLSSLSGLSNLSTNLLFNDVDQSGEFCSRI